MDGDLRDALKRAVGDYSGGKRKAGGKVSGRLGGQVSGCCDCGRYNEDYDYDYDMQGSGAVGGAKKRKPRKKSGSVVSGGPLSGSVVSGAKKRVTKKDQQELVALVNALLNKPKKKRGGYCYEEDEYESESD